MRKFEVTATISITIRKEVKALTRKSAVILANRNGNELQPLFNYGDDISKPRMLGFDEGWFDEDSISNQLIFT